jgi:hypothetical protein
MIGSSAMVEQRSGWVRRIKMRFGMRAAPERNKLLETNGRRFRLLDGGPAAAPARPLAAGPLVNDGAFTPTLPRGFGPLFVGREAYLRRLMAAVRDERAHVVLYGDRGVGKTSLTNAFGELSRRAGYLVLRRSCGFSTTYDGLFQGVLDGAAPRAVTPPAGGYRRPLEPDQVVDALAGYRGGRLIAVIDEYDRVEDERLRSHIAETIKSLSDRAAPVAFVIVGVAASLTDLLGRHPSIQRNVVGVHLAPMSDIEIHRLIEVGARAADIDFAPDVALTIAGLARGMPYYAHSLCLFATRVAATRESRVVTQADLDAAITELLGAQDPEFNELYQRLAAKTGDAA